MKRFILSTVIASLALAGCTSQSAEETPPPTPPTVEEVTETPEAPESKEVAEPVVEEPEGNLNAACSLLLGADDAIIMRVPGVAKLMDGKVDSEAFAEIKSMETSIGSAINIAPPDLASTLRSIRKPFTTLVNHVREGSTGTLSIDTSSLPEDAIDAMEQCADGGYKIPDSVDVEGPESSLTLEQENAIEEARGYINSSTFSRKGLIEQLEYEGYSAKASKFAVDYIDIDWKEQAALSAESYLNFSSFSRQGLIEQLEYEGFTRKQAEYGVKKVGY